MKTIKLDTVTLENEDALTAAARITGDFNVAYEVVTESGPAGGNPIIRYVGPERALQHMVLEHYGPDAWDTLIDSDEIREMFTDYELERTLAGE